jgi:crotonobetainyl-CoA:carnitine CoA-transferase CaiB-like acyl-CoA transferase
MGPRYGGGAPCITYRPVSGGPLPGLEGLRVLDLSDDVAGAYCAKLLSDAGATVTRVEDPSGHSLRHWSVRGDVGSDGDADGALFRFLASSHHSVVLDFAAPGAETTVDALAAASDVAIVSTFGGHGAQTRTTVDPRALHEAHSELVVVSLSAFGLTGPRASEESSEFLIQALSGSLHNHGSAEGLPLAVGGALAEWSVGTYGALGAVSALTARRRTGLGDLVDISALESLTITFICYPSVAASMPGGERRRSTYTMTPSIEPCSDGYVGMATITMAQWKTFLEMIERPDLADDDSLQPLPNRRRPDVLKAITDWTRARTVDEVVQIGSMYRIPTVPLGNGKIFPHLEQVEKRELYGANPRGEFPHPRPPFRSSATTRRPPGTAPTIDERRPAAAAALAEGGPGEEATTRPFMPGGADVPAGLPLEGVRVLDFTAFLAGPMCTQYLACLGADVIKVESLQRPDPMRFSVLVDASVEQWYEQGSIYQSANLNKRSVTLNLSDPRGRDIALRLAATADVVIENFTPRVMEQFGLTYDDLRDVNPDIIMMRMPGFGLEGPWRDRPGFAASMEQVSGLAWITGYTDSLPTIPGICDPLAGMHAAFAVLTALEHRARTGEGQQIEQAMIDLAGNLNIELVLEHSAYGHLMERLGNRQPGTAHQGVYATFEPEHWVALRFSTDQEWDALRTALGSPEWSLDPSLDTASGRSDAVEHLTVELASWFAGQSQKDALSTLRAAGVPAEPVIHSYDVDLDDQMNARGFWEGVTHPIVGTKRFPAWPIVAASRRSPWFRLPAPLLGEHSEEVFTSVGVTSEELEALLADAVIGTRPSGL